MTLHNGTILLRHKPVGREDASIRQGIGCDTWKTLVLPLAEWLVLQNYISSGVLHLALLLDFEDTETDCQDDAAAHHPISAGRHTLRVLSLLLV